MPPEALMVSLRDGNFQAGVPRAVHGDPLLSPHEATGQKGWAQIG